MKQKRARMELIKQFGHDQWPAFRRHLKDATEPYPITVDWRCMAMGRRRDGKECAFGERLNRMPDIDKAYVLEHFTYVRFVGSDTIYRYSNSAEMRYQIQFLDEHSMFDDMEEGEVFILESPRTAASHDYANKRREAIKNGEWEVKPRGPNPNMRREPVHHFRPY